MQQLLTGRTRFPEFVPEGGTRYKETKLGLVPEDWEVVRIGELMKRRIQSFKPDGKTDLPSIELEHLESDSGRILGITSTLDLQSNKTRFRKGDILFGKLRPYLNKFAAPAFEGVCTTEIWVLTPTKKDFNKDYLYYLIQERHFQRAVNISEGSKMPRAVWAIVKETRVPIPSYLEQKRIIEFLLSTDNEISALAQRKEYFQLQKKGLMQQLLTGAVRVKP